MTKNRGKENKEQEEKRYSKTQQFTEQMDQFMRTELQRGGSWSIREGRKQGKTERKNESSWREWK